MKKNPCITILAIAVLGACATAAQAEREPVLKQIDLPHPYYYREMYLPQLTSGPSSLAWSPDSQELVYSMAGTLWRQSLDRASHGSSRLGGLRLPTRLVRRRTLDHLQLVSQRCDGAVGARSDERRSARRSRRTAP